MIVLNAFALGSLVAQVRVVFEAIPRQGHVLPERLREPLAYVQDFEFAESGLARRLQTAAQRI